MPKRFGTLLVVLALAVAGCGDSGATTTAPSTAAPVVTESPTTAMAEILPGFASRDVVVAGRTLHVAVADTTALRTQGLMGVTDLGGLDGMLFVFPADSASAFWMKDTPIALDIWFFDAGGVLVDALTMEPCEADPCPLYEASGVYHFALETPAGSQPSPEVGATLEDPGA
jgi:uncharacterized membrane protein (UPF0127 family)